MATNFLIENNYLQSTASPDTPTVVADVYEAHGVFSLNSSFQLQGSLWLTKNGELLTGSLGPAEYTVYDKDGMSVGITQTGITANAQAQYITTPVSATVLQDLTHYLVKITIVYGGQNRIAYTGIALGE